MPDTWKSGIHTKCIKCGDAKVLDIPYPQWRRWKDGEVPIQDAIPGLPVDDRERLISGYCGSCFDKLFGGDDEAVQ